MALTTTRQRVYYRGSRWCIRSLGSVELATLWAWVNTLEGAVFEALQLATKGYRERDIYGNEY